MYRHSRTKSIWVDKSNLSMQQAALTREAVTLKEACIKDE